LIFISMRAILTSDLALNGLWEIVGKGRGDEDAISPMHKCVLDAGSLLMAPRGLLFVILKGVGIGLDSRGQLAWATPRPVDVCLHADLQHPLGADEIVSCGM